MNGNIGNLINACVEIWKAIGIAQKISILLILLFGVSAGITVIYLGSRPDWQILYSGLDEGTASEVYELVRDENVPYRLKNSGRTILVPSSEVYSLRLKATNQGISVGAPDVGWELFDNVKFGLTEKQQEVEFQRAVQGELQRMIVEMPGVKNARVMIAQPKRQVFRGADKDKSTASVMVVMAPGHVMSASQINSIRYLVSSAVDDLMPTDVTVTDNYGKLLAKVDSGNDDGEADTDKLMSLKRTVEMDLKEKAEAILRPILGEGNVMAMVTCELDFNEIDRVSESYDDKSKVVVNEKSIQEESSKSRAPTGGKPGASSNLVAVSDPEGEEEKDNNQASEARRTIENKYLVPKTTERFVKRGPLIKGLSVAVTVAKTGEEARSKVQLEELKALVISAVGAVIDIEGGRVDNVEIIEADFQVADATANKPVVPTMDNLVYNLERLTHSPIIRPLLGLAMLLFLYRVFRANFARDHVEHKDIVSEPFSQGEMFDMRTAEEDQVAATPLSDDAAIAAEINTTSPLELVRAKSESDPLLIAGAVESWLKQESE